MKKKMIIGTLSAALVIGGAFAVGAVDSDNVSKVSDRTTDAKSFLSIDEVKKIALQKVEGVIEDIELEKKSGKTVYEVEIEKGNIDYDVYIDAYSGEVYYVDRDNNNDGNDHFSNKNQNNRNSISRAEAIAIAEKAVNGKVVEIEKDEDDGLIKYEVELKTDRGEAEVEIHALTGKVLEVEWDD